MGKIIIIANLPPVTGRFFLVRPASPVTSAPVNPEWPWCRATDLLTTVGVYYCWMFSTTYNIGMTKFVGTVDTPPLIEQLAYVGPLIA